MEKDNILKAGMKSSEYFHIDDIGARHKGMNHYVHAILGLSKDEQIEKIMISDDAKQFWGVAILHALCWIHEIRYYRKLNPFLEWRRIKLHDFLTDIWKFYEQLKEYKENPDDRQKEFLERQFEELFSTRTDYEELDKRIALTISLHNNPVEIALRELVIKKKISYGTRSEYGRIA
ncbi:MAG: hypothetical protein DRO76_00200 [Candidatus Altiarchaeales archaeon]|nr:MAG: hypothetical protein DRO76_00200 [Candidatus Altiarchaeales archaeon]